MDPAPEFKVVLDRRQGERRKRTESYEPERRAERRLQAADLLRFHGIGIIRRRQAIFARPR